MVAAPLRGFAMRSIGRISPGEAKEMGLEIHARPAGPEAAWVELEFKIEGKLKGYDSEHSMSHVELEVREGRKLLLGYAALQEKHPSTGHVKVQFMANRAFIDKLILTIVVGEGTASGGAYELYLRDFVDLAKIH